jgi:hypothetical protein
LRLKFDIEMFGLNVQAVGWEHGSSGRASV